MRQVSAVSRFSVDGNNGGSHQMLFVIFICFCLLIVDSDLYDLQTRLTVLNSFLRCFKEILRKNYATSFSDGTTQESSAFHSPSSDAAGAKSYM
jgi:hypothetical protein